MSGTQRETTLRFLAAPMEGNEKGHVEGGTVLAWIDKAGYAEAVAWSGSYCVTAYVGNVRFSRPVLVGELVEVQARIVHTGRSSMHIVCTVSSGNPRTGELAVTCQCLIIFVATDGKGKSVEVPPFNPESDWEREQQEIAIRRVEGRKEIEEDMARQVYTDQTEALRRTLRFLAKPTDVNWGGKVHGGIAMEWIDEAANLVAETWHQGPAIPVFAGGVRFYRPIHIGHLVEVEARLIHTGHSSMHVSVHVRSGDPMKNELETTTHCLMVLVALDETGTRKRHVRSWNPKLPEDLELQEHAKRLIDIRQGLARRAPREVPH
ncbi:MULTISPECIES: acyl-CoA thioesterase [unclassified Luteococcus]|uniref:acyl-CoA thioesterase n=1 Tax=unclassified Luteococcus TaxID=2639923 RepID=UPI00313DC12C